MNIPYVDSRNDFDVCQRFYRRAIWNTLLELKPRYSLEIGTYLYQSSRVWSEYYKRYQPDGCLITADIALWNRGEAPERVYPVMVFPHVIDIEKRHGGIDVYFKEYKDIIPFENSTDMNCRIINSEMNYVGMDCGFGLTFVDGDHRTESFVKDLVIAKTLTEPEGWILIDDVADQGNEQYLVYQQLRKHNHFYEYDDWKVSPGLALIQNKELTL